MTPRERRIVLAYFDADLNAKTAAREIGLSAERVRQVVRRVQGETGCRSRIALARIVDPWNVSTAAPHRRRRRPVSEGQEGMW